MSSSEQEKKTPSISAHINPLNITNLPPVIRASIMLHRMISLVQNYRKNERDNHLFSGSVGQFIEDRGMFDVKYCPESDRWSHVKTGQDARYFGMWKHESLKALITFAEGDLSIIVADTPESWDEEIASVKDFFLDMGYSCSL